MKLLFIATVPPPVTGQSIAAKAFLDQLNLDGHSVVCVNLSKNTFRQGISSLTRVAEIIAVIWKTLRLGRSFDAVYMTTSESLAGNLKDILLLLVLGSLRKKTWLHLHGGAGMRKLLENHTGLLARINRYFLMRVAGVIVLGERLAPIFDGYIEPGRIRKVKNFASENLFIESSQLDEKWSAKSESRVLFLSNLLLGKGHEELLKAIRLLSPETAKRFRFDFAGGFESVSDQKRFIIEISDLPSVKYHGIVHGEAKKALFENAHIFCLPTYYPYEGQPISILEAYASGCAVLTTNHSGIFDIFTPMVNGLEVLQQNPESIKDALQFFAAEPSQAEKFGRFNSKQAINLYTRKAHISALYAAVDWNSQA